jgi:hypothetical protein
MDKEDGGDCSDLDAPPDTPDTGQLLDSFHATVIELRNQAARIKASLAYLAALPSEALPRRV